MPDESQAVCRRWHTAVMGHRGAGNGWSRPWGWGAPRGGQRLEWRLG